MTKSTEGNNAFMLKKPTLTLCALVAGLIAFPGLLAAHPGHDHDGDHHDHDHEKPVILAQAGQNAATASGKVSGQGDLKFRVVATNSVLPAEANAVLVKAHGGFAVDRREGKGETYFALPGAGILRVSADLKTVTLLETPAEMKNLNMHNTTIWFGEGGAFLTFPANDGASVFTTTLDGKLVHTLGAPANHDFGNATVNEYFQKGGKFVPTDVESLGGLYYIATGYSPLDFVLTARIAKTSPFEAAWSDLVFGGKGEGAGKFGTGHGITVVPGGKIIAIADRPQSEIEYFTPAGKHEGVTSLPKGSLPCDIEFLDDLAIVGCLEGPDKTKGAPIYLLKGDELVSTIMPKEELGLENFKHIHNATMLRVGSKLYIIAQAWNPGDFAILEQVE